MTATKLGGAKEEGADTKLLSPSEFYIELPLYQTNKLENEALKRFFGLFHYSGTLDCYCAECSSDSVFQATLSDADGRGKIDKANATFRLLQNAPAFAPFSEPVPTTHPYSAFFLPSGIITRTFRCTRNSSHIMNFVFRTTTKTIEKIGQHPSYADIALSGASRYRKALGEQFPELRRALGLHSHGIGIGAFVYLRRIFEALVEEAHRVTALAEKWTPAQKEAYSNAKMADRIKLLKQGLPKFLVDNADIYGVLSVGIHALTETQCLQYFDVVRNGIELILEEKIAGDERNQRLTDGSRAIVDLKKSLTRN